MNRRRFITGLGAGLVGTGLAGCKPQADGGIAAGGERDRRQYNWKMITAWPANYPGLGTGANYLAELITKMSGGQINITVYGGGEIVPPLEVFDAVANGTAELGHSASYYWKGKSQAAQFFGAVPFGMNAQEMTGWLTYGGGNELWRKVYGRFGIVPVLCGHSGVQMGGWFNREINSVDDLRGLKMRIPGLGGEVLTRAGGTAVSRPGNELFTALQTGDIDATEWVGPYNDLAFGLYKAARYYYYPGWHEPNAAIECLINQDAWATLPDDLKATVLGAGEAAAGNMLAEFTAQNHRALQILLNEHKVELRRFPDDVLDRLRALTKEVMDEIAADDAEFAEVYRSYTEFQRTATAWHDISEKAYYDAR